MSAPTKFTGLILASGVKQSDPTRAVIEALSPFSVKVLSSELMYVRDRFIFSLLIELSPDHQEAIASDLEEITKAGEIDVAYEFAPFAIPPSQGEKSQQNLRVVARALTPALLLEVSSLLKGRADLDSLRIYSDGDLQVADIGYELLASELEFVSGQIKAALKGLRLAGAITDRSVHTIGHESVILDMDSTFINEEVIDLLAELAGVGVEVAAITENAMQGNLDFATSLKARVELLKGKPSSLLDEARSRISLTAGASELVAKIHSHQGRVGIVSGGFHDVIDQFLEPLGLDLVKANRFEIVDGLFTGKVLGEIVDSAVKAETLRNFSQGSSRAIAIGDGANDIAMINSSDMGIAFCAKPALAAEADLVINERDLRYVELLLGY